jgi:hypothetical protein
MNASLGWRGDSVRVDSVIGENEHSLYETAARVEVVLARHRFYMLVAWRTTTTSGTHSEARRMDQLCGKVCWTTMQV